MPIINDFVMKNLIYCEDTSSFVHRLLSKIRLRGVPNHNTGQNMAWEIVAEMNKEERKKNGTVQEDED